VRIAAPTRGGNLDHPAVCLADSYFTENVIMWDGAEFFMVLAEGGAARGVGDAGRVMNRATPAGRTRFEFRP